VSEQNKSLVRRFYEEVENKGNLALVDELFAPDFKDVYNTVAPFPVQGREGIKRLAAALKQMMDLHITVEELVAEGDKVVARFTSRSTHKTEFFGVPATGKQLPGAGVEIFRIANGKIAERWVYIDMMPTLAALGVLPPRR
jgi:steroid delta-isomerase-like uncharacterized protein